MPTINDVLVQSLSTSQMLLQRFVGDFNDQEFLKRSTPDSNCAAWMLGHLILTERRALAAFGAADLPALPENFEKRFGRDNNAPQAKEFGDVKVLLPLFNQHRQRLIEIVKRATPEQLDKPLDTPRPMFKTAGEMASFMALHVAVHTGQIQTIRRVLGRPILV